MEKIIQAKLEAAVFAVLAENEIITLTDQRATCKAIARLLLPPNVAKVSLAAIVEQLKACHYMCEAGPLEDNLAFHALMELSNIGEVI